MAAAIMLPVLVVSVIVSRGPASLGKAALSSPVASFNIPLTPEQVERRIVGALPKAGVPTAPPVFRGVVPGSIELAALRYPGAPPDVSSHVPPPIVVDVPRLTLNLGSPSELRAPLPPLLDLAPLTPDQPAERPTVAVIEAPATPETPNQCVAREPARPAVARAPASLEADFAQSLVAAALEQQHGSVSIYQARYVRISYPGGDVSPFYGVCTDVVIRAYRALGVDLQREVQAARVGRGDTSIDHRRTETLRLFFARVGETLPVTDFAEDYRPGDIVTYYRPQNRSSTAHIAIVSDVMAPSGRPMIIHNRGFGVQLEDALFVDKITGHYRYRGTPEPIAVAALPKPKPAVLARIAMRAPQSRPPGITQPGVGATGAAMTIPTGVSYAVPFGR